jgi:hypothetical protein
LVRADLVAFKGRQLTELLAFLVRSFAKMDKDVSADREEARRLVDEANTAVKDSSTREMPIFDWQAYVSALVKWYAHIYQVTSSATFYDPRTARPEGHGEASHMAVLRRNEAWLFNRGKLVDTDMRVTDAATALFDAYVKVGTASNVEERFVTAYQHWLDALENVFPTLMAIADARHAFIDRIRNRNVGTIDQPHSLGAVLDRHLGPSSL